MLGAGTAGAQVPRDTVRSRVPVPPPRDSAAADTAAADTLARAAVPDSAARDTVKAPIAAAPRTVTPEVRGRRVVWDREAIFASGALTLAELLAQVQGTTALHAGFIAAVSATSWYGEPGRVRVYLDGIELDVLDPREGGVRDLGVIQLWSLEEVAVERTAGELRVHLRSWRVRLTTAETRTDIATGSENTNLYRGFFGKRMDNGGVFQIAAQQYSTTSVRTAGDGDALAAFGRVGVARGRLTVDAAANRFGRTRTATIGDLLGTPDPEAIPRFSGRDVSGYVRVAWGDANADGLWLQAMASAMRHIEDDQEEGGSTVVDTDTAVSQTQYIAAAGYSRWGARVAATGRMRIRGNSRRFAPTVRASWENRWASVSAFGELAGPDSTDRTDATVLLTPFPWLHLGGSHAVHTPQEAVTGGLARTTSRAEAGVRLWGRWVSGGVIRRSVARVNGPVAFDTAFGAVATAEARGLEASVSGRVVGPLWLEWRGIQWDAEELYRVRTESFTELRVVTGFERWLTRGNFRLTAAVQHEYRGAFEAPAAGGGVRRAEGAGIMNTLLEIRLGTAHIFWYNRNINGKVYETVPGFLMPRMLQLYGVRWDFWN